MIEPQEKHRNGWQLKANCRCYRKNYSVPHVAHTSSLFFRDRIRLFSILSLDLFHVIAHVRSKSIPISSQMKRRMTRISSTNTHALRRLLETTFRLLGYFRLWNLMASNGRPLMRFLCEGRDRANAETRRPLCDRTRSVRGATSPRWRLRPDASTRRIPPRSSARLYSSRTQHEDSLLSYSARVAAGSAGDRIFRTSIQTVCAVYINRDQSVFGFVNAEKLRESSGGQIISGFMTTV